MRFPSKKYIIALIAGALGALALVAPAFAGIDRNHNETFLRDAE
jgi:hypothetical protein